MRSERKSNGKNGGKRMSFSGAMGSWNCAWEFYRRINLPER